jgi:hypothetical protein
MYRQWLELWWWSCHETGRNGSRAGQQDDSNMLDGPRGSPTEERRGGVQNLLINQANPTYRPYADPLLSQELVSPAADL